MWFVQMKPISMLGYAYASHKSITGHRLSQTKILAPTKALQVTD
jgi:hypothetical protein